jgi:hypothetical protein
LIANGHPDHLIEKIKPSVTYREPLLLFRNAGNGFKNVSGQSGRVFSRNLAARGLALRDFNNDGAVDVLVTVNNGAPLLLRNNAGRQNHWLGVNLVGKKSNPGAIGARVTYQAGDLKRRRAKVGGGSYLSSHDPRMVFPCMTLLRSLCCGNKRVFWLNYAPRSARREPYNVMARTVDAGIPLGFGARMEYRRRCKALRSQSGCRSLETLRNKRTIHSPSKRVSASRS